MRPLPDITDDAAMAERGRRSAIMSARNDGAEAARNAFVAAQSARSHQDLAAAARALKEAGDYLQRVAGLMASHEGGAA